MSIGVGWNKRGYSTKLDYQGTRERLEEYVKERGCVPRDRAMREVIQERHTGSYQMNTGQVGQLVKYSRRRGILTSFVLNGEYYLTTVDNMNAFTSGNWKEVNQKAREPKENFLANVIKKGRSGLIDENELENIRIESRKIREAVERKKRGGPRNKETGQYKGEENNE